jgi:hypothetical protein
MILWGFVVEVDWSEGSEGDEDEAGLVEGGVLRLH